MADDKVASLDLGIHRTGQHDERHHAAHARHLVRVARALEEQYAVNDKDGNEDYAERRTDRRGDLVAHRARLARGYLARGVPPPR